MLIKPSMIARGTPPQQAEQTARPVRAAARERSYSKEEITPEISLTVSAVLAAFTVLVEDLSSLPLLLYARMGRNKFRAYDSIYYKLMHDQPNPEHTSMIFRELMAGHLLAWGNFYGQMIWDKAGDVQEIWPLRPDKMTVERLDGQRIYTYYTADGKKRIFLADEILHIPAFGFNGLIGYSRIAMARNSIGLSISAEKYGSAFFSNGANFDIVIRHPGTLSDDAHARLRGDFKEKYSGVENSHTPVILEEDMSIDKIGIPPDDAQFLETRKFQVSEIARIFRIPPHMIGDVEKSTSWGTGIDSQEQGYVNHTLRPWATRIEQGLNIQLLPAADRSTYYFEHLMDGLMRGDIQARFTAYVQAITNGIMSRNEARARENLNPYKGGDDMLMPLNMTTVPQQNGNTNGDGGTVENVLEPLWREAIARVLRREKNDLLGAARRWLAKGQTDVYLEWIQKFYSQDHQMFIREQFQPLITVEIRLHGWNDSEAIENYMLHQMGERLSHVKELDYDEIAAGIETYQAEMTEKIINFVNAGISDHLAMRDEEDEYDW
jgi:HK97 family phage portal protein